VDDRPGHSSCPQGSRRRLAAPRPEADCGEAATEPSDKCRGRSVVLARPLATTSLSRQTLRVRGRALLLVGIVLLTSSACVTTHRHQASDTTSPATSTPISAPLEPPTTTAPQVSSIACRGGQLQGRLGGVQGGAGNLFAGFWVADVSPEPCSLQSPVHIDVLSSGGTVGMTANNTFAPVSLGASATLPAAGSATGSAPGIATMVLQWPSIANAALVMGGANGQCPKPLYSPASVRITFGNGAYIVVTASLPRQDGIPFQICGTSIGVIVLPPPTPGST
jgi:hypothetical protein